MQIHEIAEALYSEAIFLKKYDARSLMFKKNRGELENKLAGMREEAVKLKNMLAAETAYSESYTELAEYMISVIDGCAVLLKGKEKNYRATVQRRIWGLHNLPRAYLSGENPARTSAEQAYEYFAHYIK